MHASAKTKVGLVYERPGNQCKARSHEEVSRAAEIAEEDGVKTGLTHKESLQYGGPGSEYADGLYYLED